MKKSAATQRKQGEAQIDIDDRERAEVQLAGEKRLLEMVASGHALTDVLTELCKFVETTAGDCKCGVYLIDWNEHKFRVGAAPGLPATFNDPLEGLLVTATAGPCGTAALTRAQVIASDFESDPLWQTSAIRPLALAHGIRSQWSTPIFSRQGDVLGTFAIFQDHPASPTQLQQDLIAQVTHIASIAIERALNDEALRRNERELKLIVDTIPALAWSGRPDGSAEFFNRHFLDYVGLTSDQASDWGWTTAVHPDDREGLVLTWQAIMASEQLGEGEARLRRHDGEYRWFLFRGNPVRDESGRVVKWYGINIDITERQLALDRLQSNQDLLELAQKSAGAMAFDWYPQQEINCFSPEQEALYGLAPGTFDGTFKTWKQMIYAPDWPMVVDAIKHARQRGKVAVEFRVVWPDGTLHWLATNGRMFFDDAGEPLRVVGFTSDVTRRKLVEEERRLSEEALTKARSELAHVTRVMSLGALTASIAHEVNQPLSGIITNASTCVRMLDADPPNVDGARETAKRTIRDGRRAADVITRLRALFSKKDAATEFVDLNEATREVIALSRSELERNRVITRTELADQLPLVLADRVQLQQVILNLLRNASDAMSDVHDRPRELLFRTEVEGDCVCLRVRDAGSGFEPQVKDRLFQSFYTTKADGMGIGLSVSRSIIESHRGRLWVTPNDGPGVTFSFSIPAAGGFDGSES